MPAMFQGWDQGLAHQDRDRKPETGPLLASRQLRKSGGFDQVALLVPGRCGVVEGPGYGRDRGQARDRRRGPGGNPAPIRLMSGGDQIRLRAPFPGQPWKGILTWRCSACNPGWRRETDEMLTI